MRFFLTVLAIVLFGTSLAIASDENFDSIRMGVREDVPPFVWRDPLSGEFTGFFWDICTAALARAGYKFESVPINATQRADLLKTGSYTYCQSEASGEEICIIEARATVQLLCDPTTITLDRMRAFMHVEHGQETNTRSKFVFSPVLFLANGSYFKQSYDRSKFRNDLEALLRKSCAANEHIKALFCPSEIEPPEMSWLVPPALRQEQKRKEVNWEVACKAILSTLMEQTESASNKREEEKKQKWPPQIWPEAVPVKPQFEIWGFVRGATIETAIIEAAKRSPSSVAVCTQAFDSHDEAVKAFCSQRIFRYFGDIDLVRARVEAYRKEHLKPCPADETPSIKGTYEPYALVLSSKPDGFPEAFNFALYSMFSDGTMMHFFDGRFGVERRSQYLETLFRINSLPSGKL